MKRRTRKQRGGLFAFGDVESQSEAEGEGRGWIFNSTKANERIRDKEKTKCCVKYDCDSLYKVDKFNELDVKLTQFIDNVKSDLLPYLKTLRQLVRDDLTKYSVTKGGRRRTQVRRRR